MKFTRPDPKPAPRPKRPRRGLQPQTYQEALERRRRGKRAGAGRGTSHSRREREWGRMAFAHTWPCDVAGAYDEEFRGVYPTFEALALGPQPCGGRRQYMHLHLEEGSGKRAPDHQGAIGCEDHHKDIDGKVGGKGRWYVALGGEGQLRLRRRLVERQCARWDELTQTGRAIWDRIAKVRRRR